MTQNNLSFITQDNLLFITQNKLTLIKKDKLLFIKQNNTIIHLKMGTWSNPYFLLSKICLSCNFSFASLFLLWMCWKVSDYFMACCKSLETTLRSSWSGSVTSPVEKIQSLLCQPYFLPPHLPVTDQERQKGPGDHSSSCGQTKQELWWQSAAMFPETLLFIYWSTTSY